jgi:hypothetical protein
MHNCLPLKRNYMETKFTLSFCLPTFTFAIPFSSKKASLWPGSKGVARKKHRREKNSHEKKGRRKKGGRP